MQIERDQLRMILLQEVLNDVTLEEEMQKALLELESLMLEDDECYNLLLQESVEIYQLEKQLIREGRLDEGWRDWMQAGADLFFGIGGMIPVIGTPINVAGTIYYFNRWQDSGDPWDALFTVLSLIGIIPFIGTASKIISNIIKMTRAGRAVAGVGRGAWAAGRTTMGTPRALATFVSKHSSKVRQAVDKVDDGFAALDDWLRAKGPSALHRPGSGIGPVQPSAGWTGLLTGFLERHPKLAEGLGSVVEAARGPWNSLKTMIDDILKSKVGDDVIDVTRASSGMRISPILTPTGARATVRTTQATGGLARASTGWIRALSNGIFRRSKSMLETVLKNVRRIPVTGKNLPIGPNSFKGLVPGTGANAGKMMARFEISEGANVITHLIDPALIRVPVSRLNIRTMIGQPKVIGDLDVYRVFALPTAEKVVTSPMFKNIIKRSAGGTHSVGAVARLVWDEDPTIRTEPGMDTWDKFSDSLGLDERSSGADRDYDFDDEGDDDSRSRDSRSQPVERERSSGQSKYDFD